MTDARRLRSGYSDLGRVQIPPRPQALVLTDRADGTLWLITFNTGTPERLSISTTYSTIATREGVRLYDADDGPKMDEDGEYTIIIRSGRIGIDYTPFAGAEVARDDAPPYARKTSDLRKLEISSLNMSLLHLGYII